MVEYSQVNIKLLDAELKKIENCCQKESRNNSENEFKNAWSKWSASWIIIDKKIKNEPKKCI